MHPASSATRWQSIRWILALGSLALSACAWIDAKQRELIYRPTPGVLTDWQVITPHDEAVWLPASSDDPTQRLRVMWLPQSEPAAPAVLYLHGTFRNLFQNRSKIAAIHAAGFAVLAVDYRGWGESSTVLPSEAGIVADAQVAWGEFTRRAPCAAARVIFGHSMGSAVAVEVAWLNRIGNEYGALVLEAPFTSIPDIARDRGGLASILAHFTTQHFDTLARIGAITVPKWFIAGTADRTVPPDHNQRLYAAATPPRTLRMIEGGSHSRLHNDDPPRYGAVWQHIASALQPCPAVLPPH